ncbi:hypothetical protein [Sulfuricurvum sp.]
MLEIIDTLIIVLFVLFLVYIFRGYHLARLDKIKEEHGNNAETEQCS